MYILFETIASDDPRLNAKINITANIWHYSIGYIAPEHVAGTYIDWLDYVELTEEEAKSDKWCSSVDGELTVLTKNFGTYKEIVSPSSGGNNEYVKQTYFLNDQDVASAVSLIKKLLKLHAKRHIKESSDENAGSNPTGTFNRFVSKVNHLENVNGAQVFIAEYLKVDFSAYTVNYPRNPEFEIIWS
jgi:hypothetical protein